MRQIPWPHRVSITLDSLSVIHWLLFIPQTASSCRETLCMVYTLFVTSMLLHILLPLTFSPPVCTSFVSALFFQNYCVPHVILYSKSLNASLLPIACRIAQKSLHVVVKLLKQMPNIRFVFIAASLSSICGHNPPLQPICFLLNCSNMPGTFLSMNLSLLHFYLHCYQLPKAHGYQKY